MGFIRLRAEFWSSTGCPARSIVRGRLRRRILKRRNLIIGMEWGHLKKLRALCPKEQQAKLHLLLDFAERQGDIEDPWYTDDFDRAYRDILRGCEGLLRNLTENKTA